MPRKTSPSAANAGANDDEVPKHRPINSSAARTQIRRPRPRVHLRTFFADWQSDYASHGIATFPLRADKSPAISHYNKVGLPGSAKLATKFATAPGLGFMGGRRNKVTVFDVDTRDERVLADAINRHGATPIIIRTASGKWHLPYRFNGERRRIRPWDGLPVDLLGEGGFVVAAPSEVNGGQYEFVQGGLDDLDRLPILKGLEPASNGQSLFVNQPNGRIVEASPLRGMRDGDGRNSALFLAIGPQARELFAAGGTHQQLLDFAQRLNAEAAEPMDLNEVTKIVGSIWKMTERGDNHIGQHGVYMQAGEIDDLTGDADAFFLLAFLRAHQGSASTFWIANGLAETFGWTVKRLAAARLVLIERKKVQMIRRPRQGHPAQYAWPQNQASRNPLPILTYPSLPPYRGGDPHPNPKCHSGPRPRIKLRE